MTHLMLKIAPRNCVCICAVAQNMPDLLSIMMRAPLRLRSQDTKTSTAILYMYHKKGNDERCYSGKIRKIDSEKHNFATLFLFKIWEH